jgi:hypothetical protein
MALRYLFDENLRGELWRAVAKYNAQAADLLDVIRVGDPGRSRQPARTRTSAGVFRTA